MLPSGRARSSRAPRGTPRRAAERHGQDVERRASMSDSSSPSGPSHREPDRASPPPDDGRRRAVDGERQRLEHQFASSASCRSRPASGSAPRGASWWRISSAVRGEHPAATASSADARRGSRSRSSVPRIPGTSPPSGADPPAVRLAQRADHAAASPASPLPASWSRPGEKDFVVGDAAVAKRRDHVEPVSPVGDVHGHRTPRAAPA